MSIAPKCDYCKQELTEPGGILFTPPERGFNLVEKYHVCVICLERIKPMAQMVTSRLTDEQVENLAERLGRETAAGWGLFSPGTRAEIVKRWVDWLNINLPADNG